MAVHRLLSYFLIPSSLVLMRKIYVSYFQETSLPSVSQEFITNHQQNIQGKTVVITEGTESIGLEIAQQLSQLGAQVIVTSANSDSIQQLSAQYPSIRVMPLDLHSFQSVHEFVELFHEQGLQCNILINNTCSSGHQTSLLEYIFSSMPTRKLIKSESFRITQDGLERNIQANYWSLKLLTSLLQQDLVSTQGKCIHLQSAEQANSTASNLKYSHWIRAGNHNVSLLQDTLAQANSDQQKEQFAKYCVVHNCRPDSKYQNTFVNIVQRLWYPTAKKSSQTALFLALKQQESAAEPVLWSNLQPIMLNGANHFKSEINFHMK